jgi:diguanylate cyclase (GGDEF)-like protein/PAS domain S-box-containing protein
LPTPAYDPAELLNQLEISVLVTDTDGRIVDLNYSFERASGYSKSDLLGKIPYSFSAEAEAPGLHKDLRHRLRDGLPFHARIPNRKNSGEIYHEDTSILPVKDSNGQVTGWVWAGRPTEADSTLDLFKRLTAISPSGVVVFQAGKIRFVNSQFERVSGYENSELAQLDPLALVAPEDRELVRSTRRRAESKPFEYRMIDKQGHVKWVIESASGGDFLSLDHGATAYTASTIVDITRRKATEEQLQYALTLYAATVESTTDGILVVDTDRIIRQMNNRLRDMWNLPKGEEYVDHRGGELFTEMLRQTSMPDRFIELGRRVYYSGDEANEIVELLDGRVIEVHTTPQIIDGSIAGQVWSFRDVTERERTQSNLAQLARMDALTGIPSRRSFQEAVDSAISRGEHGAVLFMDVDDFKAINDSLGHTAGDEFLQSLSRCLSAELRRQDVLARLGGDEFAVLLRGVSRGQASSVAQRMLKAVREMKAVSADQPFASTISIGGALFPAQGTSVDELLGHADMAMYRAKRGGRNGLRFYQTRQGSKSNSMSRVVWKQKLLDALEHDRFTLYAQPIFELRRQRLGCYELLLRLREPNGRLVLPQKFLPAAAQSGLIQDIDMWVVRQSMEIARQLSTAPHPMKIAINLSATAVGDDDLFDLIKREVSSLHVDPGFISVEVSETALIADLPKARAFFQGLKEMGFLIALDNFGGGFSSLSRLKEIPADYLKIDGSFVENISRDPKDRHFVRAISDLATGLGIGAVAESIQDAESVAILMELGVLNGQGPYLGEAQPVSRILERHLAAHVAA